MKVKMQFRIREFTNPSGEKVVRVQGYKKDGLRIRENFEDIAAATVRQQQLEAEYHGVAAPSMKRPTTLTEAQLVDAEAAIARLGGKSVLAAVEYFLIHGINTTVNISLTDALRVFISAKEKLKRRQATIDDLKDRVTRFIKDHPTALVSDISRNDVQTFIDMPSKSLQSSKNDRTVLHGFFAWCKKQGYSQINPVAGVACIEVEREEVSVLRLDGVQRLVDSAVAVKDGACLPYVALGLFCAIRPKEIVRLTWDDIDLKAGTVTVSAKIAKMRQRRIVEIPGNALAMLIAAEKKKVPLRGNNFGKNFAAVRRAAGFVDGYGNRNGQPFPPDVMRHTAISYHLALHNHEGKTATWAGNSPDTVQRHYRALVKQVDVPNFWRMGSCREL
jgi:integrase